MGLVEGTNQGEVYSRQKEEELPGAERQWEGVMPGEGMARNSK